jgi:hypothetical protein
LIIQRMAHSTAPGRRPARLVPLVLALALACAGAAAQVAQDRQMFASDEAGFEGDPLASDPGKGYVLFVSRIADREIRSLVKDGAEVWKLVIFRSSVGRTETRFARQKLAETSKYDAEGNLLEERLYAGSAALGGGAGVEAGGAVDASAAKQPEKNAASPPPLRERRIYTYSRGLLLRVESRHGKDDSLVGSIDYRYDANKRLVEILSSGGYGGASAGLIAGAGFPSGSWTSTSAGDDLLLDVTQYDRAGRPNTLATFENKDAVRLETLTYSAKGVLARSRVVDSAADRTTETSFDDNARPVSIVISLAGKVRSRESLTYDEKGRIIKDLTSSGLTTTSVIWIYDEGDEISRATAMRDGLTVSAVIKMSDGSTIKELYDKGRLFVRARYIDGRLRSEDFISDGAVVRSKDYP